MATVLLTGCNRGIGLQLAIQLVARGDSVIGVCRVASDDLQSSGAEIVDGIDVADVASIAKLKELVGNRPIDVVINNAGILRRDGKLGSIDYDTMLEQYQVNTLGPLRVTEALLDSFDADIAMHNVRGGLRAGLPAGQLAFSDVYEMFPFDNFATKLEIRGDDLRRVIAAQAHRGRRVGFAGMRVFVECADIRMSVRMVRTDGSEISDEEDIVLLVNDFLALGGDDILTPIIPPGGFELRFDLPRTRDALVDWLRARGGKLDPANWRSDDAPKWNLAEQVPAGCELPS